jgi:hypothetical protein
VVVGRGVIQETFDLFLGAVARLTTEVQPMVPVHPVIRFRLSPNLVRKTKATTGRDQIPDPPVECSFVFDVVQAYRTDHEIERSSGEIERLEAGFIVCKAGV